MRNVPEEKKLQIKSELIKHLTTAKTMEQNNVPSSQYRVLTLEMALEVNDMGFDVELELGFWRWVMDAN